MKKILFLSVVINANFLFAQSIIVSDSFHIIPQTPSVNDEVKLAYHINLPTQPCGKETISVTYNYQTNEIFIDGHYYRGDATAICEYYDTVNIGKLKEGDYTLYYSGTTTLSPYNPKDTITFSVLLYKNISEENSSNIARVYPNPTNESIKVLTNNNVLPQSLSIYNTYGQLIKKDFFVREIDMKNIQPGIYMLHIEMPNITEIKKIVVY